jgi:GntR family transcriptional regulator
MLPFTIALRAGQPILEQVVYAVTKAVVTGQLQTGDPFPSVRVLSQELKINPNTGHKIVAALVEQGALVVRPGVGTVVAPRTRAGAGARRLWLQAEAERRVVEAKRSNLDLSEVLGAIRDQWTRTASRAGARAS